MSIFILPICTIVFSVYFLFISLSLPTDTSGIGSGGWPNAILGLMLVFGIVLLVNTYRDQKKTVENDDVSEVSESENENSEEAYPYRHWVVLGIIFLYFFAMKYLGMLLTTPFFIIAMGRTLGYRSWLKIVIMAIVTSVLLVYLFTVFLSISLPGGVGVFSEISSLLY